MSDAGVVIIGGGLAAGRLVSELRERGHGGPVTVLAGESHPPYERPPLSKGYLLGQDPIEKALVNAPEWYAEHDVDLRTGVGAEAIDPAARRVIAAGESVPYEELVIATGARPRHLGLADDSGAEVHYLRTWDDAVRLRGALTAGTRVVVIGGGWIGLEAAAAAREHDASVTVLESADLPLLRVLGPEVAEIFAGLHREHGVDLRTGVQVTSIRTETGDGTTLVDLSGGESVTADVLLVGVGVSPATELAEAAGLTVDDGIRTDDHLRTSAEHVWAIGDVAEADHPVLGFPLRVEHWDTAIQHAKVVAANLSGEDTAHTALPYFFTDQYDFGMEYVGHPGPEGYDRVVLTGDVPGRVFKAWWLRGDLVVAGMHGNDWDAIDEIRRVVGTRVDPERLG